MKEKIAGIAEAPIDVRNLEFRACRPAIRRNGGIHWDRDFVVGTVNRKNSVDGCVECAVREGETIDAIGPENKFGILGALEDIFLHFGIAAIAAGAATGGSGDDFTGDEACRGIDADLAAFQIEFAMHIVRGGAQCEI